jgi:ArsR family transcriptional regulator, arsenate/arsenite/antimonite-responsive transcriptional repressor
MDHENHQDGRIAQIASTLKLLSVEARLRILVLLRERDLCVGALTCRLGLSQGAVSQHLKILRDAGLVTAKRKGPYVHYRVNEDRLREWRHLVDGLVGDLDAGRGSKVDGGQDNVGADGIGP